MSMKWRWTLFHPVFTSGHRDFFPAMRLRSSPLSYCSVAGSNKLTRDLHVVETARKYSEKSHPFFTYRASGVLPMFTGTYSGRYVVMPWAASSLTYSPFLQKDRSLGSGISYQY